MYTYSDFNLARLGHRFDTRQLHQVWYVCYPCWMYRILIKWYLILEKWEPVFPQFLLYFMVSYLLFMFLGLMYVGEAGRASSLARTTLNLCPATQRPYHGFYEIDPIDTSTIATSSITGLRARYYWLNEVRFILSTCSRRKEEVFINDRSEYSSTPSGTKLQFFLIRALFFLLFFMSFHLGD